MLKLIPFYSSLLGKSLRKTEDTVVQTATQSHVLVYGAIEAHSMGPRGCIASNKKISEEIGLSVGRVANIISELTKAGWIDVTLDKKNHRAGIVPCLTLHSDVNPPSRESEAPLHVRVNIDNNREHSENKTKAKRPEELLSKLIDIINPREKSTADRLRKLNARLGDYKDAEILNAAKYFSQSTWHKENKQMSIDNLLAPSKFGRWYATAEEGKNNPTRGFA